MSSSISQESAYSMGGTTRSTMLYTLHRYNFCWVVRTLRIQGADGRWQKRTPAMAAGLARSSSGKKWEYL